MWTCSCSCRRSYVDFFLLTELGPVPVPGGAMWTCSCSWRSYLDLFLFLKSELRGPILVPGGATWTCSHSWRSYVDLFLLPEEKLCGSVPTVL